ncbi:MAG TPA: SPOR domain-containing protein [Steroidobacteraceae bacterium]|nr:SPOR domain-containing protein [Steroidobacteraceae bacterium]HRX88730.1 SPOR domain-containing protein [Steroidobacteraceae bacterium]
MKTVFLRMVVTSFALGLTLVAGCSREQGDWRSAQAADTVESYERFISQHADSTLATQARERIDQLLEERDWQKAATADTLQSYQQFLTEHANGKWSQEARIRIDNFAVGADPAAAAPVVPVVEPARKGDLVGGAAFAKGEYGVQLGAFSSSDRANVEWQRLAQRYPGPLEGLSPRVAAVASGDKALYRLQASVIDEAQARAICNALKVDQQPCVVVLPKK